jgi:hypothetical protein
MFIGHIMMKYWTIKNKNTKHDTICPIVGKLEKPFGERTFA